MVWSRFVHARAFQQALFNQTSGRPPWSSSSPFNAEQQQRKQEEGEEEQRNDAGDEPRDAAAATRREPCWETWNPLGLGAAPFSTSLGQLFAVGFNLVPLQRLESYPAFRSSFRRFCPSTSLSVLPSKSTSSSSVASTPSSSSSSHLSGQELLHFLRLAANDSSHDVGKSGAASSSSSTSATLGKDTLLPRPCLVKKVRILLPDGHEEGEEEEVVADEEASDSDSSSRSSSVDVHSAAFAEFDLARTHDRILGRMEARLGLELLTSGEDVESGIFLLRSAAESRDPEAIHNLGVAYEGGVGVEKDLTRARRCYKRAAKMSYAPSMFNLAIFYQQGLGGIAADHGRARKLSERATEIEDAQDDDSSSYHRDFGGCLHCRENGWKEEDVMPVLPVRPKVELDADRVYYLARAYHHGLSGTPPDPLYALQLYREAATTGGKHPAAETAFRELQQEIYGGGREKRENKTAKKREPKQLKQSASSPVLGDMLEDIGGGKTSPIFPPSASLTRLDSLCFTGDSGLDTSAEMALVQAQ